VRRLLRRATAYVRACTSPIPTPPPPPPVATGILALLGGVNVDRLAAGVRSATGIATKHLANPRFTQTEPWEENVKNGYPTVIHDPEENK